MRHLLKILIIFGGLYYYFMYYGGRSWVVFFLILFAGVIIPELIPVKSKTVKKINQKKTPKTKISKKKRTDEELLHVNIVNMDGYEFERICAMYFKDKGYDPKIIGGSGDHGVDIVMADPKHKYKIAVQCKHHNRNIGNDPIIKIDGGKRFYDCIEGWVIITTNFTPKAKEFAEKRKVKLLNGLYVQETIGKWQKKKIRSIS